MLMLFWGSLIVVIGLLLEHIAFWNTGLKRTEAYTLGVATLGIGFTAWSMNPGNVHPAVAFWVIAGVGGFTVVSAYWVRSRVEVIRKRARGAGAAAEETAEPDSEELNGPDA